MASSSVRYASAACAIAAILAGCSSSAQSGFAPSGVTRWNALSTMQSTAKLSNKPLKPANLRGGFFNASYAGHVKCSGLFPHTCLFHGTGTANFLGSSKEHIFFVAGPSGGYTATLRSAQSKKDSITTAYFFYPCTGPMAYTISGGTGRFSHATGAGLIAAICKYETLDYGTYTDTWTGTLYY
jgi:hypothetical protein